MRETCSAQTDLLFPLLDVDERAFVFIHKGPHGRRELWRREEKL